MMMKSGAFKDTQSIADALLKMEAGKAYGFDAYTSLRSFDIIETKDKTTKEITGRTLAIRSAALGSAIKSSGRYRITVLESTPEKCRLLLYGRTQRVNGLKHLSLLLLQWMMPKGLILIGKITGKNTQIQCFIIDVLRSLP